MFFNTEKTKTEKRHIPLSAVNMSFPIKFVEILNFHLPADGKIILDPTCGDKHSWKHYFNLQEQKGFFKMHQQYEIVFSDIKKMPNQNTNDFLDLKFDFLFDAIFFDPPYIFGGKQNNDPLEKNYGGYDGTYEDLIETIEKANNKFPLLLKEKGLLFFKCADVFSLSDRKYYHNSLWTSLFCNFIIIDCFIIIHHHISGTAWQVKNRPCSIGNHTYLYVLQNNYSPKKF